MDKYMLAVRSAAKAGRDEEFRNWYKHIHIPELLQITGFMKATRYYCENPEVQPPYLTLYEIQSGDIQRTLAAMQEQAKDMTRSEALEEKSVSLQLYRLLD